MCVFLSLDLKHALNFSISFWHAKIIHRKHIQLREVTSSVKLPISQRNRYYWVTCKMQQVPYVIGPFHHPFWRGFFPWQVIQFLPTENEDFPRQK